MNIVTPEGSDDIYRRILDKCIKLIDLKYWEGVEKEKLLAWAKKFQTQEEMYLAAAILNTLIYRSKAAVESLGANIFHIVLPQILSEEKIYEITSISDWENRLKNPSLCRELPFRFSAIESVDSRPGKSGSVIYRALRRKFFDTNLGVNVSDFSSIDSDKIKAVIFFDDMLGSAGQFDSFAEKYSLDSMGFKIIYIPLAGHVNGIELIQKKYKNIIVSPVERLDCNHSFFSAENRLLNSKNISSLNEFETFYKAFCKKQKFKLKDTTGHDGMALTYCFYDSTPNNNLALLWYKDEHWPEFFTR